MVEENADMKGWGVEFAEVGFSTSGIPFVFMIGARAWLYASQIKSLLDVCTFRYSKRGQQWAV